MILKHQACLLLGSNIEPEINIPRAVSLLQAKLTIVRVSSVYETPSADCCYPNYLNMAVLVSTELDRQNLRDRILRPLEASMGRVRSDDKNASRTIDLDIILFDGQVIDSEIWQQVHVAVPVSELLPSCRDQTGRILKNVAHTLARTMTIQPRPDVTIPLPSNTH